MARCSRRALGAPRARFKTTEPRSVTGQRRREAGRPKGGQGRPSRGSLARGTGLLHLWDRLRRGRRLCGGWSGFWGHLFGPCARLGFGLGGRRFVLSAGNSRTA